MKSPLDFGPYRHPITTAGTAAVRRLPGGTVGCFGRMLRWIERSELRYAIVDGHHIAQRVLVARTDRRWKKE